MWCVRGDGPLDLAHASGPAEGIDDALGFFIGDKSCDTIHAGLAVDGVSKGGGNVVSQEECAPVPKGGGVKEVEGKVQFRCVCKDEFPAVAEVGGGLERAIGVRIVCQRDGGRLMRVGKCFQVGFVAILHMPQFEAIAIGFERNLADPVVSAGNGCRE